MIKNTKTLDQNELQQLEKLYIDYFKQVIHYRPNMSKELSVFLNKLLSKRHTKNMISKIMNDERISFTLVEDDNVIGFITGHGDKETKDGWLSHLYVDAATPLIKRIYCLQLYREFATTLKSLGMETVSTRVEREDIELIETLDELTFEQTKLENDVIEYGTHL